MATERRILIPGMGCDRRLFGPQQAAGLDFEVLDRLPIPKPDNSLATYARHIRDWSGLTGPCVLGGVSFGGMLACELAAICQCRCVLLIAGARHRSAIPPIARPAEWLSRLLPDAVIARRSVASTRLMARLESLTTEQYHLVRDMLDGIPVPFTRRTARMILNWKKPSPTGCPVYHIHGAKDRIIPLRRVKPDEVINDGGHMINLTHPEQVNHFIQKFL